MSVTLRASAVLVEGEAEGEILVIDPPLSFWGGIDPQNGTLSDPRHPQFGQSLTGRIVVMARGIGSSSGSSILLELLSIGEGPLGILMGEPDAILSLGAVVAREMGYGTIPVWKIDSADIPNLPARAQLYLDGTLEAR